MNSRVRFLISAPGGAQRHNYSTTYCYGSGGWQVVTGIDTGPTWQLWLIMLQIARTEHVLGWSVSMYLYVMAQITSPAPVASVIIIGGLAGYLG